MQTHGGAPAEEAINSRERHLSSRIRVDWNRNGLFDHALSDMSAYADRITTDRSLKGSAPEELFLIEGAAAAEMTFTAGGEYNGQTLMTIFSLYNPLAPMYFMDKVIGAAVEYDLLVDTSSGTVTYPQFRGFIQSLTPVRGSNEVEFRALDRVELMRRPFTLSDYVPSSQLADYPDSATLINYEQFETQSVIDACLRSCQVSPSPYVGAPGSDWGVSDTSQSEGLLFFAPLNGGNTPSVGTHYREDSLSQIGGSGADTLYPYSQVGIKHPSAPTDAPAPMAYTPISELSPRVQTTGRLQHRAAHTAVGQAVHYISFTMDLTHPNALDALNDGVLWGVVGAVVGGVDIAVLIQSGSMRVRVIGANGTLTGPNVTVPTVGTHNRVTAIVDNSNATGCKVYLKVGTNSTAGFIFLGVTRTSLATGNPGHVGTNNSVGLSDVAVASYNISNPSTVDRSSKPAPYAAGIDRSLNRITWLPRRDSVEAWSLVQEVAEAELGSVFWDEEGRFRFWNFQTMVDKLSSPVRTLTLDDVSGVQQTFDLGSIRNNWSVKTTKRRSTVAWGFHATDIHQFLCPPLSTVVYRFDAPDLLFPDGISGLRSTKPGSGAFTWYDTPLTTGPSEFVAQYSATGTSGWAEPATLTPVLSVFTGVDEGGYFFVSITNSGPNWSRFARDGDVAAFRVSGRAKGLDISTVETHRDETSITKFGTRNLSVEGDWVQDSYNDDGIIGTLMPRAARPIPKTDALVIAGDPRLQLGDALILDDPDGLGEELKVQVYGITRSFSKDEGLTDTLTIEVAPPTWPGLWDDPIRGRWDESFIWS